MNILSQQLANQNSNKINSVLKNVRKSVLSLPRKSRMFCGLKDQIV